MKSDGNILDMEKSLMNAKAELQYLLDWAGEISKTHPFIDFHVHPFDVFSGDTKFQPDPKVKGLFSRKSSVYQSPTIDFKEDDHGKTNNAIQNNFRAILLVSRLIYSHTGSKVFTDQLDLAGITKALLLPVVRNPDEGLSMMDAMKKIFHQEKRLCQACPIPVGVSANRVLSYYKQVKKRHKIYAIKIHPNLSGIDPLGKAGSELIEETLIAAAELKLSVVIHGGITPGLSSPESRGFGRIERLAKINWDISSCPVVIAHAGCYGLAEEEISSTIRFLNKMMEKSPNLLADTSALDPQALKMLLAKVNRNRLIFGSDALYFSIWKSWVNFLDALQTAAPHADDELIRIAYLNPIQCLNYTENSVL
jgi:predicted TIM-barrel fold metal-dependent hydrolase